MKISYSWLQTYFKETLPAPEEIAEALTFQAFEVEGIEKISNDTILDVKVLPDRAHYALSHRGIARELSAILGLTYIPKTLPKIVTEEIPLSIKIENNLCRRYMGRIIENVKVGESPARLKEKLEAVGSRSINSIVDATNFVMLDTGQPLHAFDADKVKGGISVRNAKKGEKITLLDGKEVTLDESILIIADEEGPLAIAGVKGGKKAEVTGDTRKIILESANFNPSSVRKTSTKIGIRNDSSKRFENNLNPEVASSGMAEVSHLISTLSPDSKVGNIVDHYPAPTLQESFSVSIEKINEMLGLSISSDEMSTILRKLEVECEIEGDILKVIPPLYRNDIKTINDIVEEIGRIYGYDWVPPTIPDVTRFSPQINKTFYYSEKIKNMLVEKGFSEVYTYSLVPKGFFEIEKPLAADKNFLRANLTLGIVKSLALNAKNADLLGLDDIKIFEIGKVFCEEGEHTALTIGIKNIKKKQVLAKEKIKQIRDEVLEKLESKAKILCSADDSGGIISLNGKTMGITNHEDGIMELNLDVLVESLPEVTSYDDLNFEKAPSIEYKKFSLYPYIVRDIALFVSSDILAEEVRKTLFESIQKNGKDILAKGPDLFDQFEKDGKKSLAFRMIFQATDRTLLDSEVNEIMEKAYEVVKGKGWEVR